jgi:flagella basal body P-ring formation protein FlgA
MRRSISILALVVILSCAAASSRSATVEALVSQWVYHTYSLDTTAFEIEVLSNSVKTTDVADERLSIKPLTQREPLGLFTVLAELERNGTVVDRGQVRLRIRKYADVLVATDRLARQDLISSEKIVLQRMEVTSLQERPLIALEDLEGFRMKRNLSKGKILTSGAVEPIPDIDVGEEVTIVYNDGLCTITAPGRSMQSGSRGARIRVRNNSSGKVITAQVVDDSSVSVGPLTQ